MSIEIIEADFSNSKHAESIIKLLNNYAQDPMGGGEPLSDFAIKNLIGELSKNENAFCVLACSDNQAIGMAICFFGFSTFKCRPLVNIHDFTVDYAFRGKNISQLLLDKVEEIAAKNNCCKITLEVLEGNEAAKAAYNKFGFAAYELDPKVGKALFWEKIISSKK